MSICLCNLSADTALEIFVQEGRELEPAERNPSTFLADPSQAASLLGSFAERLPSPIDLLVGSAGNRRRSKDTACHVWRGPIPQGSILRVYDGVYVTSPEFTLLQQASQLHQVSLCQMLGRYLGTWSPTPNDRNKQIERAPLTTFEQLNGLLSSVGSVLGTRSLRLAMAHTCEGAASAPETSLQLALTLPPELHGFALPDPTMNYKVDLSQHAQRMCGRASIRIDLCWPQSKFGLEYQGEGHEKTLGEDYARWFAAREEGYELWFLAKEQLTDPLQMDYVGREVACRLGIQIDEELWPNQGELQELLEVLAGAKHPKPVSNAEIRRRQAAVKRHLKAQSKQR